jgi:hypothetical protein
VATCSRSRRRCPAHLGLATRHEGRGRDRCRIRQPSLPKPASSPRISSSRSTASRWLAPKKLRRPCMPAARRHLFKVRRGGTLPLPDGASAVTTSLRAEPGAYRFFDSSGGSHVALGRSSVKITRASAQVEMPSVPPIIRSHLSRRPQADGQALVVGFAGRAVGQGCVLVRRCRIVRARAEA